MKTLERRVEKLEEQINPKKEEFVTFVVVYGDRKNPSKIEEIKTDILWRGQSK